MTDPQKSTAGTDGANPSIWAHTVVKELAGPDIALAYDAMLILRPHIGNLNRFRQQVEHQRADGYRLVGTFNEPVAPASAVAGFRVINTLAWGRCLYVDDLSTLPAERRGGHATTLLRWLQHEASRVGCDALHLDSNIGAHRSAAHRVYLKAGMAITSLHFAMPIAALTT